MKRPTAHRWLVLGSLSLVAACSASGSADVGISGPFGVDAGVRRDGVVIDTGRRVDVGREVDTGRPASNDSGAATPGDDSGTANPSKDGGTVNPGCGAREMCGNGLDDDCNGMVDENCPCVPGTTRTRPRHGPDTSPARPRHGPGPVASRSRRVRVCASGQVGACF